MRSTTDFEGWSRATSISKTEVTPSLFVPRDTMHSPSSRNFWNEYDERSVMAVAFGVHRARSTARPLSDVAPTARTNPSYCVASLNQTGCDARYLGVRDVRLLAAVVRVERSGGDRRSEPESLVCRWVV